MHLLKGQPRGLNAGAEPVDLEQSPGDIVILSAADTEISGLAAARRSLGEAFPSVRLANWMQLGHPYSVDLYGEKVLAHARLVVLRLLGGASYWRYGLDEAVRLARANGTKLVVLPGDATWDGALSAEGTAGEDDRAKALRLFRRGRLDQPRQCAALLRASDRARRRAAGGAAAAERGNLHTCLPGRAPALSPCGRGWGPALAGPRERGTPADWPRRQF